MALEDYIDRIVTKDVLVVGTGGAGLRAARGAAEKGVDVALVSKGKVGRSGVTIMAGSDLVADGKGIAAIGVPGDPNDSPEAFMKDIVREGFYLNNQKLVECYVNTAKDRLKELVDNGLKILFAEGRTIFATGKGIVDACMQEVKKHNNVEFFDNIFMISILTRNGRTTGAIGIEIPSGKIMLFKARAIVLATGGWHKMYGLNSGSTEMSGDGVAAALRAGCEATNLEMVTFCSSVIVWPERWRGSIFFYIFHSFAGGELLDRDGKSFLERYYPDKETFKIATKTEWNKLLISLAQAKIIREGRETQHGGVYYSIKDVPWEQIVKGPASYFLPKWNLHGDDCSEIVENLHTGNYVEVRPQAHYFEGGIRINDKCETSIQGLYAAGECTGGMFGANRVAAATTEMLVQGAIAGEQAGAYAKESSIPDVDTEQVKKTVERILTPFQVAGGMKPSTILSRLQKIADDHVGVIRNETTLKKALEEVEEIKRTLPKMSTNDQTRNYNLEWVEALEVANLALLLESTIRAALMRTESRGVHYREDCPYVDNDNWLQEIVVRAQQNGSIQLRKEPVTLTTIEPPKGRKPFDSYIVEAAKAEGV